MCEYEDADGSNVAEVMHRFADCLAQHDGTDLEDIATWMNEMLDDLLHEDFFGTEGQDDPRGDHRD